MMTVMMPVVLMMTTMVTVTMTMMVMVMVINLKQHVVSQFRDNEPHLARLQLQLVMMTMMVTVMLMMTTMVMVIVMVMVMVMVINLKQHIIAQFCDNEPHLSRLQVEQGSFVADLNFRFFI